MNVFERLHQGEAIDIRDNDYQREVHGEMDRCRELCFRINSTSPTDRETILELENELCGGQMRDGTFFTPPFQVDLANCLKLGKNVFANHGLTVMSLGGIEIEDGVMMGPEVGLFTVNHEPEHIRVVMTKKIHIKKNAWIGARVNILPGVTIGENAIVGTGSIVTKDIPDNAVAVGNPARVVKFIK
ncbi:MAG: sugar O-acetyltransferase [Solobacterium sp.]|nr:sugar O-acetyltransferase [Solobacterium sp.]